jgi:hypothetical protein
VTKNKMALYPTCDGWIRQAPWTFKQGKYFAAYSRTTDCHQIAQVRIAKDEFDLSNTMLKISGQLNVADINERGFVDVTRPSRKRSE